MPSSNAQRHRRQRKLGIPCSFLYGKVQAGSLSASMSLQVHWQLWLSIYQCISLFIISVYLSLYPSSYLPICLSIHLSLKLFIYLFIHPLIYVSIYGSICVSTYLSYSVTACDQNGSAFTCMRGGCAARRDNLLVYLHNCTLLHY